MQLLAPWNDADAANNGCDEAISRNHGGEMAIAHSTAAIGIVVAVMSTSTASSHCMGAATSIATAGIAEQ
ncbi:hypothetical protein OPT61_g10647 [Boeremia exigua]|uniref:Uncharacterized protein n=1 Tax=Boeremia exigua TaxID=749465 RepID=A0ACC2HPI7_9PLEO|nr:hypothetical protein OPT61_g10647 [Boeremia exigua]